MTSSVASSHWGGREPDRRHSLKRAVQQGARTGASLRSSLLIRSGPTAFLDFRDIKHALEKPGQPLFAVFVDYKAAFDSAPRSTILQILADVGVPDKFLSLLTAILQSNNIRIDDGVAELPPFSQTTGVAQGDNLSPLLFSVLLKDLPTRIRGQRDLVKVILYADDLVIYGGSRFQIQQALARLHTASIDLGLTINKEKTVAMKFRRGGRAAADDNLRLEGSSLVYVNKFSYLGLLLSPNGHSFRRHISERCRKALIAISTINKPQLLSVETAIRLFDLKIAPIASYGVSIIWNDLTAACFEDLNRLKAAYLKRVLGLHRTARNRLAYLLVDTPLFSEELRSRFDQPATPCDSDSLASWEQKFDEIDPEFYNTGAMQDGAWKGLNRQNRHIVTRYAVHGFHHSLCGTTGYHEPNEACRCIRCGLRCTKYHASLCPQVPSIGSLAHA